MLQLRCAGGSLAAGYIRDTRVPGLPRSRVYPGPTYTSRAYPGYPGPGSTQVPGHKFDPEMALVLSTPETGKESFEHVPFDV